MCSVAADDALALIEAGLEALADAGPESADGARLEKVRRLVAGTNRMTAMLAGAVRDAETHQSSEHDGLKSMKSWLRTHTRLSGAAITGLIREGRAASLLSTVEAAFLAGTLTP